MERMRFFEFHMLFKVHSNVDTVEASIYSPIIYNMEDKYYNACLEHLEKGTTPCLTVGETSTDSIMKTCMSRSYDKRKGYIEALIILNNIENRRKENIYQSACEALTDSRYLEAINEFSKIVNYKDSAEKIELCKASIEKERKDRIYKNAFARLNTINVNDIILKQSISDLQSIIDYKDSEQKIAELQARLEKYYYDKGVLYASISKGFFHFLCLQNLLRHPDYKKSGMTFWQAYRYMKKGKKARAEMHPFDAKA